MGMLMKRSVKIMICIIVIMVSMAVIIVGILFLQPEERDYRQDMRNFVQGISTYAKVTNPNFLIIPQNGQELLTEDGEETGTPVTEYLNAIDGVGREDLFYGYTADNVATPASERNYMMAFLDLAETNNIEVLVTNYPRKPGSNNNQ